MAATTTLLGLVTPTQGSLSGSWGDTVNYGISDYVDIAIAGTLSFAGDGAITLANTTGSSSGNAITSTTAQYMVIRITGTQTVTKVITGPSYSKLYMVDHAGATSAVTFKAAAQTGVSIAVGEKCFVYYNGTDYVKISSINSTGIVPVASGGTGLSSGTSGGVLAYTASGTLASSAALTQYGVVYGGGAGVAPSATANGTTGQAFIATTSGAPSWGVAGPAGGGTGVANNAASTITISGSYATTLTLTGTTSVTLPTSGTLATLAGSETFTNKTLTNPTVTNYVETLQAVGTVGSTSTLALTTGTVLTATLTASTPCTFTMPTATAGKSFILKLTQASSGMTTATFTSVKWPGGTAPTITATASAVDILSFVSDGTNWYGTFAQAFA